MRLKTKWIVANFAYAVLLKCAKSMARINDIDTETAMSLISMVKPEIYWTKRDTKRIVSKVINTDGYNEEEYVISWAMKFFGECVKRINRKYTRLVDCSCVESMLKKEFGLSATDLYYLKTLLSGSGGLLS